MIEKVTEVAGNVVDALRKEPVSLVLIVLNLLFIAVFYFTITEISESAARRDTLLSEVARACVNK